jgi:ATP/maltotriose-dependent transcriptional regulator MalT
MRAPELQSLDWIVSTLMDIVPVFIHRGRLEDARAHLESLSAGAESDNPESRASYSLARARLLRAEGRPAQALDDARAVIATAEQLGLTHTAVKRALVEAVECAFDLGDLEQAEDLLATVQRARPGQVTPFLGAHAARLAARVASLRGDLDSVEPGFGAAQQGFRDLGAPFDLAVALLEHAEWLVAQGRAGEPHELLREARALFADLEASPWLERLDRTAASVRAAQEVAGRV